MPDDTTAELASDELASLRKRLADAERELAAAFEPVAVLAAAERLLRPVMANHELRLNGRGSTNGVHAYKPVQFWWYAGDGTSVVEGDTLAEAYARLLARNGADDAR